MGCLELFLRQKGWGQHWGPQNKVAPVAQPPLTVLVYVLAALFHIQLPTNALAKTTAGGLGPCHSRGRSIRYSRLLASRLSGERTSKLVKPFLFGLSLSCCDSFTEMDKSCFTQNKIGSISIFTHLPVRTKKGFKSIQLASLPNLPSRPNMLVI